ncbi:HNH endonuclease (plasmid) [Paenibacillus sp. JNUCC32]|uniref:NUMOD4 domain-containing protein n=1 Tax=Paenibacillus sp. JNUCC32 TaxID=2777984 RepID=UPI001787C297|nr:HNH endonuclease [Paenibacillus sp. JNUCC-32]QOT13699.1 HNH endonuclease [Paenibacillus sp. JNUCC-32]
MSGRETWRRIEGFCNYEVSDTGLVRNITTRRVMRGNPIKGGYLQICLVSPSRERKMFLVHRLVAIAFIPNPDGLPEVNHRNGIKTDNFVSNLEWCDRKYNIRHAFATGLFDGRRVRGEDNGNSKLKDYQRMEILADQRTLSEIAKDYGVTPQAIWHIKHKFKAS